MIWFLQTSVATAADENIAGTSWIEQAGSGIEVLAGAVAVVTAIIGVPVAWMNIRKTRETIRKLDLESRKIEKELAASVGPGSHALSSDNQINISIEGEGNAVQITNDTRLAGPLLLLIDFTISIIILILLEYGLGALPITGLAFINRLILAMVAATLLIPIFRDARNVQIAMREQLEAKNPSRSTS